MFSPVTLRLLPGTTPEQGRGVEGAAILLSMM